MIKAIRYMSYGELTLDPVYTGVNKKNGRFMKGHVPANKGKKWSEYLSKRMQKRCAKGWKNLDLHRFKNGRPDTAGRCRKPVIAVLEDGTFKYFPYSVPASKWIGGTRENVNRCCRMNISRQVLRKPQGKINTDHKYKGVRFYFEEDGIWTRKINAR